MTTVSKAKATRQLSLAELLERRQRQRVVENENVMEEALHEEENGETASVVLDQSTGKEEQQPCFSNPASLHVGMERAETMRSFSGYAECYFVLVVG